MPSNQMGPWLVVTLFGVALLGLCLQHWQTLRQRDTTLEVRSVPTGAQVLVNGVDRGKTDAVLTGLKPGVAELEIHLEGFESATQEVHLKAGETPLAAFHLQPRKGSLKLTVSGPKSYKVHLGPGLSDAQENQAEWQVEPGLYELLVSAEGHLPASKTVTVTSGQEVAAAIELKPIPRPPSLPVHLPGRPPQPPASYASQPIRPGPISRPSPPRPRPVPRSTPVPLGPADQYTVPEPLFTPVP